MRIASCLKTRTLAICIGIIGALNVPGLAHADLATAPSETPTSNGYESQKWMIDNDDVAIDGNAFNSNNMPTTSGGTGAGPFTQGAAPPSASNGRAASPRALTSPNLAQTAPLVANAPSAHEDPTWGQELRGNLKNAVRPLYDEAVDTVHGIQTEFGLGKDATFKETHWDAHAPTTDKAVTPGTPQWETQGSPGGPQEPARTTAQIERDKVLASAMLDQLIDEIKPWAVGMLVLYALFYMIKAVRGVMRANATRRIKKRTHRAMRRHHR